MPASRTIRDGGEPRRSGDELQLVLRSITDGVTVHAPDGRMIFANDSAARLCGFASPGDLLAAPVERVLERFEIRDTGGSALALEDLPFRKALRGIPAEAVLRVRAPPFGEERWSMVSANPVLEADGRVAMAVAVFRDETDRRRDELAWKFLAQASSTLGSSLDYEVTLRQVATLAVPAVADWSTVDVLAADGTLELWAVAHTDPAKVELARQVRQRWPRDPHSANYRVVSTGQSLLYPEVTDAVIDELPHPERRAMVRQLGLRSAMIVPLVVDHRPFGVLSFVSAESGRRYDERDLVMANEIARRASLAVENARAHTEAQTAIHIRDTFLSVASHELRTPLSSLTLLLGVLGRAARTGRLLAMGTEAIVQRLEKAERQTMQLGKLVDRLLDVTRLSSGDLWLERRETDLVTIAREVVGRYEEAAARAGCTLSLLANAPVVGTWDPGRLDQVVSNLLGNAVKYARGSPITVLTSEREGQAVLAVQDRGPGIAPADRKRIFEQWERAASPSEAGMGLGLWIVRRIVEAHGGTVAVNDLEEGGASFVVSLPLPARSSGHTS